MGFDFPELRKRHQEQLVAFLTIELDLARTLCQTAKVIHKEGRRPQLLEEIRTAVETVRKFLDRVADPDARSKLLSDLSDLEGEILKLTGE